METDSFKKKYFDFRARVAKFRMSDDPEVIKTVGTIDAFINKADVVHDGADVSGRFNFIVGHNIENYMSRAEFLLCALERGEYPLRGMFTEPGIALVDHSFIEKDGKMHVFYCRDDVGFEWDTRPCDTVGHSVTEDLKHWVIERPCLTVEPDKFENYQVWSPGICKKGDVYYMYYTGVNFNVAQGICLATSKDLYHWEKYAENPVVLPGKWGKWSAECWSDCRDSMVFIDDDGTAYMYYCTRIFNADCTSVSAVGIAESDDMFHWRDAGAYHFDICDVALESPFLIKHGGKYYLFYTNCGHGTAYAVSDDPISGWYGGGMLMNKENPEGSAYVPSCSEVFNFMGEWYVSMAERRPGYEQYLEIFHFSWNPDGSVSVGSRVE